MAVKPPRATWLDPREYPPPLGNKIDLLTYGGLSTDGYWSEDCAAWAPLRDTPPHIKQRMMLYATGRKADIESKE